jgi:hypothetical protein
MSVQANDSPTVWISFDHHEPEEDMTCVHEGQYVPDGLLPFEIEDCAGTMFKMDGVVCELLGDLGGHAVYRRRSESDIYTMNWADFAEARADGIVDLIDY